MVLPSKLHASIHLAEEQALLAQSAKHSSDTSANSNANTTSSTNGGDGNDPATKSKWIMGSKEIRSLIVSAIIFLTIFAWADVLASYYKSRVIYRSNEQTYPINDQTSQEAESTVANVGQMEDENALLGNIAGIPIPAPRVPRPPPQTSKNVTSNMEDLNINAKAGYACILTLISVLAFVTLARA